MHITRILSGTVCCGAGDYFGELALLPGGTTRAATVRARSDVSLLVLDRQNFEKLLGPLLPQLETAAKNYSGYRPNKQGVQELNLSEVEQLATLGAGGFGRVTLVQYHGSTYALKQMSKGHIVDNKLVAHVHREKKVSCLPDVPAGMGMLTCSGQEVCTAQAWYVVYKDQTTGQRSGLCTVSLPEAAFSTHLVMHMKWLL